MTVLAQRKKNLLATRKNMSIKHDNAKYECSQDCGSVSGTIRVAANVVWITGKGGVQWQKKKTNQTGCLRMRKS